MASQHTRYLSINLLPYHREQLDQLVKWSGTNRNALLRKIIMSLSRADIERIMSS